MDDKNEKYLHFFLDSFPKKLAEDVHIVFEKVIKLKRKNLVCSNESRTINVNLDSENIVIPQRIYCAEPNSAGNLSDIQKDIWACIYSRHHNGFVRQKYIETLISKQEYWITPFFVQLFGEYVYEMLVIFDKYLVQNMDNCVTFVNENQKYWETTKGRMISYWNEYHRTKYPNFGAYLGEKQACLLDAKCRGARLPAQCGKSLTDLHFL